MVEKAPNHGEWFLRQANDGSYYWIHRERQKIERQYPWVGELKVFLANYKEDFNRIVKETDKFMKDHAPLRSVFPNSPPVDVALNLLREEMKAFSELYLNNMNKLPKPVIVEKEIKPKIPEKKICCCCQKAIYNR